ncbi:MAG TPA: phosphatidylinositol mannoside acyltransferase [Nocardioidaceae bacterium]|nr:phosphatidylinositol mannoside acyltransferase [Nocardioidaceae bacterium]
MNRDSLVSAGFVAAWRAVRLLPEDTSHAAFRRLADRIYRKNGGGVQQLRENLAVAAPDAELESLTHEAMRSYLRYWCEAFRLPSWDTADVVRRSKVVGEDNLRDAFAGPGAIVALPHTANWDWAGAWACATGMPVVAVAERLRPQRVYDEFVAFRRSIGMEILGLDEPDTMARLVAAVEQRKLICLLSDRDLTGSGIEVDLLGRRANLPAGPALLARKTGAAVIPASFAYAGRDLEMTFYPPVDAGRPSHMMQAVADRFSEGIRRHPQDWHMMQKVFV